MNDSFGGGGFDTSTQGSGGGGGGVRSEAKTEGVVPLVIKQILDAPESGFKLYGMSFGIVSVVGIVRSIDHSSTKITITMEDFTGQIDAHLWLEDGDVANTPNLLLNTYARLHGSIRSQNGTKVLMIIKIQTLPSINELTTHLLEVLNARYLAENFSKSGNEAIGSTGAVHSTVTSYGQNASNFAADNSAAVGNNGLKGKQLMVFNAVREHTSEQGISVQELQEKFKQISGNELGSIMEFLTSEGHCYTSIDSEHFLPTDA